MSLITVNVGSSSVRLGLHTAAGSGLLARTHLDHAGWTENPHEHLARLAARAPDGAISTICHRIVHAGPDVTQTTVITPAIEAAILAHTPLAPLHNTAALAWLTAARQVCPDAVQIAVFDTALYANLPAVAAHYAIPPALGIRRLGFHGLAHQAMLRHVEKLDPTAFPECRIISLQLGSGCSVTASRGGHAVDTSMGCTPLEGLVMGTRCGDIDPGLVLHLLQEKGYTPDTLKELLGKQSGLLGLSGHSADIRDLLARDNSQSRLAVDMFCYRTKKYIGAYMATLGGVDHIVFAGGIGEHQPLVRAKILEGLTALGVVLDAGMNAAQTAGSGRISSHDSAIRVDVVAIDENSLMAEESARLIQNRTGGGKHDG